MSMLSPSDPGRSPLFHSSFSPRMNPGSSQPSTETSLLSPPSSSSSSSSSSALSSFPMSSSTSFAPRSSSSASLEEVREESSGRGWAWGGTPTSGMGGSVETLANPNANANPNPNPNASGVEDASSLFSNRPLFLVLRREPLDALSRNIEHMRPVTWNETMPLEALSSVPNSVTNPLVLGPMPQFVLDLRAEEFLSRLHFGRLIPQISYTLLSPSGKSSTLPGLPLDLSFSYPSSLNSFPPSLFSRSSVPYLNRQPGIQSQQLFHHQQQNLYSVPLGYPFQQQQHQHHLVQQSPKGIPSEENLVHSTAGIGLAMQQQSSSLLNRRPQGLISESSSSTDQDAGSGIGGSRTLPGNASSSQQVISSSVPPSHRNSASLSMKMIPANPSVYTPMQHPTTNSALMQSPSPNPSQSGPWISHPPGGGYLSSNSYGHVSVDPLSSTSSGSARNPVGPFSIDERSNYDAMMQQHNFFNYSHENIPHYHVDMTVREGGANPPPPSGSSHSPSGTVNTKSKRASSASRRSRKRAPET